MPRAFSSAVHNAVAARLAIALGARGENQTFVHAEVSIVQALFHAELGRRRAQDAVILVGGADEGTPYVARARAAQGNAGRAGEGGAVFLCGPPATPALAVVRQVAFGRFRDLASWCAEHLLPGTRADAVLLPPSAVAPPLPSSLAALGRQVPAPWAGNHPSAAACALAVAAGALAGEVPAAELSLDRPPAALALLVASRFQDAGLVVLERP